MSVDHARWNASPKAKVVKARYAQTHRAQLARAARAKYHRTKVKRVKACAVALCRNTWVVRVPVQRQTYCLPCAMFFQYPSVYRNRSDYRRKHRGSTGMKTDAA